MTPPFRAEHIGSLLRPQKLLQARKDHAAGKLDDAGAKARRERGHPRRGQAAGGPRPAGRHRRRVPPRQTYSDAFTSSGIERRVGATDRG